jgi:adenosylcobinamide-phosphate synthase
LSTATILLLALLLDAALGEPGWLWSRLPHPAVLMGKLVGVCDKHLNTGTARRAKGVLTAALLVFVGLVLGNLLSLGGPLIELVCAAILIAQKSLVEHVDAVAKGLRRSIQDGRRAVAMIVSRDTSDMNASQVARSAIESGSENMSDGVIAPAFWFLIGGLPGLLVYKLVNTADSMIGYRTPKHEDFGWASARLDDLLNLVPARATGVMIALIGGQLARWREIATDARAHKSPNAGWPEAAMARTLDISLAGPRSYDGKMRDFPWVNPASRKEIGAAEIEDAVRALWKTWGLMVLAVALIALTNAI